jgi:serine/threonine-protein kinase RIO1
MTDSDVANAFEQVVQQMRVMFQVCKLVHADLSEFNILFWKGQCVIIDVSQSVETSMCSSFFACFMSGTGRAWVQLC